MDLQTVCESMLKYKIFFLNSRQNFKVIWCSGKDLQYCLDEVCKIPWVFNFFAPETLPIFRSQPYSVLAYSMHILRTKPNNCSSSIQA